MTAPRGQHAGRGAPRLRVVMSVRICYSAAIVVVSSMPG